MTKGVLFISPSSEDAVALSQMLARASIPFGHAESIQKAGPELEKGTVGAVLTEARLPDGNWEDVVRLVKKTKSGAAVVVTDKLADARFWADVLEFGAYDLLPKPFSPREVQRILANALHEPPLLARVMPAA
ncbi:MAG: response regulator [Acidobacteriales bacterium]|nr:MAG: response regulator [Terriglobales bacterium]